MKIWLVIIVISAHGGYSGSFGIGGSGASVHTSIEKIEMRSIEECRSAANALREEKNGTFKKIIQANCIIGN